MIAQADVGAMQGVDEKKIPPHETVAAVHGIEAAAEDARPGVKGAARLETRAAQILRTHAARLKRNPVVTVAVVEPPRVEEQPVFLLEPAVERRAGKRREVVERGDVERVLPGERDRGGEAL